MKTLINQNKTIAKQIIYFSFIPILILFISGCSNEHFKTGAFYVNGNERDVVYVDKEQDQYKIYSPGKWSGRAKTEDRTSLINEWQYPANYKNKKVAGQKGMHLIKWNENSNAYEVTILPESKDMPSTVVKWIPAENFARHPESVNTITNTMEAAVGTVYIYDHIPYCDCEEDGIAVSYGTGFIDEYGNLITCFHVIQDVIGADFANHKVVFVPAKNGSTDTIPCNEIIAFDNKLDVAVLNLSKHPKYLGHLKYAAGLPNKGDFLYSLGSPEDLINAFSIGHYVGISDSAQTMNLLELNFRTSNGASGSPVADEEGAVIGMIDEGDLENRNKTFAVPAETLRNVSLNRVKNITICNNVQ